MCLPSYELGAINSKALCRAYWPAGRKGLSHCEINVE